MPPTFSRGRRQPAARSGEGHVVAVPVNTSPQCCSPDEVQTTAAATPVPCDVQHVATPTQSQQGGVAIQRIQSVRLRVKQLAVIDWHLRANGQPISLQECQSSFSSASSDVVADPVVVLRLREYVNNCNFSEFPCTIVDAATGHIRAELSPDDVAMPGLFAASFIVFGQNSDGVVGVLLENSFTLIVEATIGEQSQFRGPPSMAEIRLHLADSDALENRLLGALKFDDSEIAAAAARAIMVWNETPPPGFRHDTSSFPYRFHWLEAICGYLFLIAAEKQRANNLEYNAGGLAVNDSNKEPNYERAAASRLAVWNSWMRAQKATLNMYAGFGSISSPYRLT